MKKLKASMKIAFGALRINKLRSALTMLGIIIGVAAVIAMVAIGSGAQARIQQQIASIGSNIIIVLSGSITSSGIRMGTGNALTLTEDDARAIVRECPGAQFAAPYSRGGVQVVYGNSNWGTQIVGTTPDYLTIRDLGIEHGQAFTNADVESAAKVALLGKTVIDNLFGGEDPVGKVIRIKSVPFTVVGTLVPKGQSPTGQDQDDIVLMPISTAKKKVIGSSQANAGFGRRHHGAGARGHDRRRAGSDDIAAAPASPHSIQSGRRLHHPQHGGSVQGAGELGARHGDPAGRDRVRLADRGRHRHHEHHAGVGDRAHQGNRFAPGRGRENQRHPGAIPGGSSHAIRGRRRHWHRVGHRHESAGLLLRALVYAAERGIHRIGLFLLRFGRCIVRLLSGSQGRLYGSDRGSSL